MNKNTIFHKIIKKEILADIVYQDKLVTAFHDIKPKYPVHILIIPNIFISTINNIKKKHRKLLGHMFFIASKIAFEKKISENGYRIVINCNQYAGQEIFYLHMHLIGGCMLKSF